PALHQFLRRGHIAVQKGDADVFLQPFLRGFGLVLLVVLRHRRGISFCYRWRFPGNASYPPWVVMSITESPSSQGRAPAARPPRFSFKGLRIRHLRLKYERNRLQWRLVSPGLG